MNPFLFCMFLATAIATQDERDLTNYSPIVKNGVEPRVSHKPDVQASTGWHSLSTHGGSTSSPTPVIRETSSASAPTSCVSAFRTPTPTAQCISTASVTSDLSASTDSISPLSKSTPTKASLQLGRIPSQGSLLLSTPKAIGLEGILLVSILALLIYTSRGDPVKLTLPM